MKKKGFTLIELLAIIVILGLLAFIVTPVILHVVEKQRGKVRAELANRALEAARSFYTMSTYENIAFPIEGFEFICNKKNCEATVGTIIKEEEFSVLSGEPTKYYLDFKDQVPSSGSVIIYHDGRIVPKNLAIDSHLCKYDEKKLVFISC